MENTNIEAKQLNKEFSTGFQYLSSEDWLKLISSATDQLIGYEYRRKYPFL